MKFERTRLRYAAKAVDLGLYLALAEVGDDATRVIVDKYIGSLCEGHSFHKRVSFLWPGFVP